MERDPFYLVQRAWAAYQAGHYDLAEREARGALAVEPNDAEALSVLSLCAMQRKDRQTAVLLGERARAQGVDEPVYHYRLGLIHASFGDHQQAEPPLDTTLALDPTFAPAYSLYAWVYYARGHLDIALKAIHEALKFDSHEQYALTLRIEILKAKGSRKLAERAAQEALAVNPENDRAHAMAGVLKLKLRQHEQGISHLREAARLDPDEAWVRQTYARALEERTLPSRMLIRLSQSIRQFGVEHYILASILWLIYLVHRQEFDAAIFWSWPQLMAALLLHVLLLIGWWGPLVSYAMLRDVAARRIIAAHLGLRQRTRVGRPSHVAVSLAVVASVVSLAIPGPYLAPMASGFAGISFALMLYEATETTAGRLIAGAFTSAVLVVAIAWAINPNSLLSEKEHPRNALAQSFPAVVVLSAVVLIAFFSEKRRRKGQGI